MTDFLNIFGDIGEHPVEVELLLIASAPHGRLGLPANRQYWYVVSPGIVKTGDQVGGTGSASGQAYAQFAGELGMRNGHERAHLLVARLDEVDPAIALEGADDAVDAIARIAEDAPYTPSLQSFDKEVRCLHGCIRSSWNGQTTRFRPRCSVNCLQPRGAAAS